MYLTPAEGRFTNSEVDVSFQPVLRRGHKVMGVCRSAVAERADAMLFKKVGSFGRPRCLDSCQKNLLGPESLLNSSLVSRSIRHTVS